MFQFSTSTLVNSLKDFSTGEPLITVKDDTVYVKHQGTYKIDKDHKICAYKALGHEAVLDTIDLSKITGITAGATDTNGEDKVYRLALYIRSVGNADPLFANAFVFKGKPFYVEFTVPSGKTPKVELVKNLNKYQNVVLDKAVLKPAKTLAQLQNAVPGVDSKTTGVDARPKQDLSDVAYLVAANPYMRITDAKVQEFNPTTEQFKDILDLKATSGAVLTGKPGFGDYENMEKDYRLPTGANLRWKRPMADEVPTPGVIYDQYTIHYLVNRGQIAGLGGVGQQITSETTHVFWVNHTLASQFETLMKSADPAMEFIDTDAQNADTTKTTGIALEPQESGSSSVEGDNSSSSESGSNSGEGGNSSSTEGGGNTTPTNP